LTTGAKAVAFASLFALREFWIWFGIEEDKWLLS